MSQAGDIAGFDAAATLIRSSEPSLQRAAARYLDQLGGRRALPLVEELYRNSKDWEVRLEAAAALARLAPVEKLAGVLDAQDPEVLIWGLWSLGRSGRAGAADWIRAATADPRSEIREAAVVALGEQRLPAETPILLERLSDPDAVVCAAAAEALGRCGDRRAVPVLRELARQNGPLGEQARRALREGHQLRLPPADTWLMVQAASPGPLLPSSRELISSALEEAGLQVTIHEARCEGRRQIDPEDIEALRSLVSALETLSASVPKLRWSVRDPQAIVRRLGGHWIISSRTGTVAREAGWFSLTPPLPDLDRPRLAAAPQSAREFHSLPVVTSAHAAADIGDLSIIPEMPEPSPEWKSNEEATESMERTIGRWLEAVPEVDAPPIRARDALTPGQTDSVIRQLSAQGLTEGERADIHEWLAGEDTHARIVACRLIEVAGDAAFVPVLKPLLGARMSRERRHATRAIGAVGDSTVVVNLTALLSDPDPDVQAAAREAIAAISGPSLPE